MNDLFLFGCSYTAGYEDDLYKPYVEYKKFRGGNFPKTWSELLSEKLNLNHVNYATGGIGNDEIFQRICNKSNEFKRDDVVIIGWTYMTRYRWAHPKIHDHWLRFSPHYGELEKQFLSEVTNSEICINRENIQYYYQLRDFENMILSLSKSCGFDVFFWSGGVDKNYYNNIGDDTKKHYLCLDYFVDDDDDSIFNEIFRRGGQRIKEETNDLIFDLHMGETGHQIQCDLFLEHITNNQ